MCYISLYLNLFILSFIHFLIIHKVFSYNFLKFKDLNFKLNLYMEFSFLSYILLTYFLSKFQQESHWNLISFKSLMHSILLLLIMIYLLFFILMLLVLFLKYKNHL